MLLEMRINSDEARTVFSRYPNLGEFMEWANARTHRLKYVQLSTSRRRKTSEKIERITIEAVHKAAKKASNKAISIKFYDSHGRDVLSPDLVNIMERDGQDEIKAIAITGTTKYNFDELIKMSGGYYVNAPTMVNLEKARQFKIKPTLIYYDASGELRLNSCTGKFKKKEVRGRIRRLYEPDSFSAPGIVLDSISPIIDEMIKEAREIELIEIKHYSTGVNVHAKCKCGCMWWVNATACLISDTVRTACRNCEGRGLINWQDVIRSSELREK